MRGAMAAADREFSKAIRRRDRVCRVRDFEPCLGALECSHFHTKGASPALRFYPYNAFAQCAAHHRRHHCGKECFYGRWLSDTYPVEEEWMARHRSDFVRYADDTLVEIRRFCETDDLEGLREYIRGLVGG